MSYVRDWLFLRGWAYAVGHTADALQAIGWPGIAWIIFPHFFHQGLADPTRVGIYGWSYGGYMALMCLMRASDVFTAAVSGAPVTHWDGYGTLKKKNLAIPSILRPGFYLAERGVQSATVKKAQ